MCVSWSIHTCCMTDNITLTGVVATIPRHLTTSANLAITSFRLASTQRRFDRLQNKWVDADTNWYTITTFRQLAHNAASSIHKGDRIVVNGRLRIRDWQNGDKAGTNIDIEADALGHDLSWGTATWIRTMVAGSTHPEPGEFASERFPQGAEEGADAETGTAEVAATETGSARERAEVDAGVGAAASFGAAGIGVGLTDEVSENSRRPENATARIFDDNIPVPF